MSRGSLRIYLGAAPGVGKTWAMLAEAQRRMQRGSDVVVGFVQTHERPQLQEMLDGLEVVERRRIRYQRTELTELDVNAILRRKPAVVAIDELAHSNQPGSKNAKRWQDVEQIRDAGIDVISTLNISHLESLNDACEAITGVRQDETIPDAVVRTAEQIELCDMTPEALRRRLAHGHIYAPDKLDIALSNYFRVGNLAALRELALLWLADQVDDKLQEYRNAAQISDPWPTRNRVVVALSGGPEGETLLRRAASIAGHNSARDLMAVYVVRAAGVSGTDSEALATQRTLTQQFGGSFHTVVGEDVAAELVEFARSVNARRLVVGESRRSRTSRLFRPSIAELVVRDLGEIDLQLVAHERAGRWIGPAIWRRLTSRRKLWGLLSALVLPALITMLLIPFSSVGDLEVPLALLAMLVGVLVCSLIGGVISALVASAWSTILTNYWFIPPENSFVISQPQNIIALIMFIVVGCTVAIVVDRGRAQADEAALRRSEAEALDALSRLVLNRNGDLVRGLLEQTCETFGMHSAALFERRPGIKAPVVVQTVGVSPPDQADTADASVDAGATLVLAVNGRTPTASERRILAAYAAQSAVLRERDQLLAWAQEAARLRASESAQRSLLAAVSHDLRTPIAGIKAALATLADDQLVLTQTDKDELVRAAATGADRLNSLVSNLLDLSRLQAGQVAALRKPVMIDEVIENVLTVVGPAEISTEIAGGLPLVDTDPALLERVLANLVENAIRQDSAGQPVRISVGTIKTPSARLDIRVMDRGPGIPTRERAKAYEPFSRAGDRKQASEDGVGLGLAVAQGLTEVIGGELDMEDTPGGGLTMVVSLPLVPPDPELTDRYRRVGL